jgi:hypothetical protein
MTQALSQGSSLTPSSSGRLTRERSFAIQQRYQLVERGEPDHSRFDRRRRRLRIHHPLMPSAPKAIADNKLTSENYSRQAIINFSGLNSVLGQLAHLIE